LFRSHLANEGTIFVGNAFSGIGPDEIVQQVIASGTPGVSTAGIGAGITPEQFWRRVQKPVVQLQT
jgi:L-asparaginase/Glu-tRNA(Gln) amidotransferase subunit D